MGRYSTRNKLARSSDADISKLVELLSELEHVQWMHYSKNVAKQLRQADDLEQLIKSTHKKWSANWKDYSLLSASDKKKDREWALRVLKILKNNKKLTEALLKG
jgi:hypothetical protein